MPLQNVTVGFIGYGNMGQNIAHGLIDGGVISTNNIIAFDTNRNMLMRETTILGTRAATSTEEVINESNVVIIAVKPPTVADIMTPLTNTLNDTIIVSIAWGIWNEQLNQIIPGSRHISVIPNIPIGVGHGILIMENNHTLEPDDIATIHHLFEPIAMLQTINTNHMSAAGTITSCAPAFTSMYIEALADAGVEYGLTRDAAYRLAAKMVEGTGAQILAQNTTPSALKDAVCSPGGATIKGVTALEHAGFRSATISAIEAVQG